MEMNEEARSSLPIFYAAAVLEIVGQGLTIGITVNDFDRVYFRGPGLNELAPKIQIALFSVSAVAIETAVVMMFAAYKRKWNVVGAWALFPVLVWFAQFILRGQIFTPAEIGTVKIVGGFIFESCVGSCAAFERKKIKELEKRYNPAVQFTTET